MSFLQVIQKFIEENNITLPYIPIDERVIPGSIKDAIFNVMKVKSKLVNPNTMNYFIEFDKNGKAYLSANDGHSILLVFNDYLLYDKSDMRGYKVSEGHILREATEIDHNSYMNQIRGIDNRFIKPYDEVESVNDLYRDAARRFCLYIGYLQEEYLESIRPNESFVMYDEVETTSNSHRISRGGHAPERKYSILGEEERFRILDSHNPVAICNCISKKSNKLAYRAYAYNFDDSSCLIIEPVSGTNFTKICSFNEKITDENITLKTLEILSLDADGVRNNNNVFHAKHTTIEVYEGVILESLGKEVKSGVVHPYTKANISRIRRGF